MLQVILLVQLHAMQTQLDKEILKTTFIALRGDRGAKLRSANNVVV